MALHANMNRREGQEAFSPSDFYNFYRDKTEPPTQPLTLEMVQRWVESMGGTVATIKKKDMPALSAPIEAGSNG